jgi:hypothetical protein
LACHLCPPVLRRCPEQCPADIAQLIEACISNDIAQRPTAAVVVAHLRHSQAMLPSADDVGRSPWGMGNESAVML